MTATSPPARAVQLAVIGPADAPPLLSAAAAEVGRLAAEAGAVVLTGGLGGVMAAASTAARAAGGTTIGLLPGRDRAAANPGVSVALPTGLGEARNAVLVRCADAVVCVGGSWGTLSEVALACRTGTPVVVLSGWQVLTPEGTPPPDGPASAETPAEAVTWALAAAGEKQTAPR